ncbi:MULTISPECIES: aspartate/glutamate racemase family protein [unclassified Pseudodesulfovibrio]|uniref:aspartate/glutamate racemase family protein n=1 Tax=unclassified Pseudodesulfovibrio TaxID=2661612 RepID=UPI000FEB8B17|nr:MULTISPECIES: aspartate/glutamate racemase family protein [unclassified Pseudodesulfovibrio]MCJ2165074.1 aspartate/glutamate racemase family protein [Pseudodesulfovibrio sp. S3-i]RWU03486.1 aspartate/glutamate racemase family protein [Pseudodesulfovibrio sp. S3]
MKTIGLLGGMSWESSLEYYRVMNEEVKTRLGGLHSAKILMYSVDFAPLRELMLAGDWGGVGQHLSEGARTLAQAGADLIVIGTNTMHKLAPQVAEAVSVPLVHIADATADAARAQGYSKVALLGTIFTMEDDFYRQRLVDHGFEVLVPEADDRKLVDRVIFDELCKGALLDGSRAEFLRIISELAVQGAEAVILGCTEIGLLVRPGDTEVPTLDTCRIHAVRVVAEALS